MRTGRIMSGRLKGLIMFVVGFSIMYPAVEWLNHQVNPLYNPVHRPTAVERLEKAREDLKNEQR